MLVAIVTAPSRPAWATVSPSRSAYSGFAFRTSCSIPARVSSPASISEISTEIVPTSTGWPLLVAFADLVDDRAPLALLGLVDLVVVVGTDHRPVGVDLDHRDLVDLHELGRLGERGPGHPGELLVEAEVVLERDRRQGLVLLADPHALLRLDRLVQAVRPPPPLEDAAGELVDDLHLAVDHRVVGVALEQRLGLQRLDQVVDQRPVLGDVEVVDPEELLRLRHPALGRGDGLVLLVVLVVVLGLGGVARLAERLQLRLHLDADHLLGQAGEV